MHSVRSQVAPAWHTVICVRVLSEFFAFSPGIKDGWHFELPCSIRVLMSQFDPSLTHSATAGNAGGLALCDKNFGARARTMPIVHVHGDLDLIVPWTGDALLGFPTTPDNMQVCACSYTHVLSECICILDATYASMHYMCDSLIFIFRHIQFCSHCFSSEFAAVGNSQRLRHADQADAQ